MFIGSAPFDKLQPVRSGSPEMVHGEIPQGNTENRQGKCGGAVTLPAAQQRCTARRFDPSVLHQQRGRIAA